MLASCGYGTVQPGRKAPFPRPHGIHVIQHVVVIMEENRSFDSFFGTYPHADGIPMKHGVPTVCVPNGVGQCVKPFRDPNSVDDSGGAHGPRAGKKDVDGGRMDGFVRVTVRIDPKTDGRPDRRPDVRENARVLGDLRKDFDFDQKVRRPLLLRPRR